MAIWQEPTTFGVKMDIWVSILFGKGVRENKTGSKIVSRYDSFAQPVLSDQAYQGPRDSLIMVIYDNPSSCDKVLWFRVAMNNRKIIKLDNELLRSPPFCKPFTVLWYLLNHSEVFQKEDAKMVFSVMSRHIELSEKHDLNLSELETFFRFQFHHQPVAQELQH